jgi:hypothetical protein
MMAKTKQELELEIMEIDQKIRNAESEEARNQLIEKRRQLLAEYNKFGS